MSYDFDLRSPEFRAGRHLFGIRSPMLLIVILILALPTGAVFGLLAYRDYLQADITALSLERETLLAAAGPLAEKTIELELYDERSRLVGIAGRETLSSADMVETIISSTPPGLSVNQLTIDSCGRVTVDGDCEKMRDAAEFRERLARSCTPGETPDSQVSISGTGPYTFRITITTGLSGQNLPNGERWSGPS